MIDRVPAYTRPRRLCPRLAALALALAGPAAAQTPGYLPRVLDLPLSARAMALGDAYVMDARSPDAVFYHPALLTAATGFGLGFQRWGPHSSAASASAATQWFGSGVGIGLTTLQYGAPGPGQAATPAGQDHLFELGDTPVSERVAVLGWAKRIHGFDLGVSGKLVEERVGGSRDAETHFDLGVARDVGPLTVGLTFRDLGREPLRGDAGPAAWRTVLGAGTYGRPLGILDVGASARVSVSDDDTTFGGGVEIGYWPIRGRTFVARLGLTEVRDGSDASPLTVGLAFWGDVLVLEWAYEPVTGAADGGTHRFGVGWR